MATSHFSLAKFRAGQFLSVPAEAEGQHDVVLITAAKYADDVSHDQMKAACTGQMERVHASVADVAAFIDRRAVYRSDHDEATVAHRQNLGPALRKLIRMKRQVAEGTGRRQSLAQITKIYP